MQSISKLNFETAFFLLRVTAWALNFLIEILLFLCVMENCRLFGKLCAFDNPMGFANVPASVWASCEQKCLAIRKVVDYRIRQSWRWRQSPQSILLAP
jgi:hypothetical protein